jgi:hypothetical protein
LQQFKNVALHPVDVGGRVLASGEIAELSPHAQAVHEAVSTGRLLALATFVEPPPAEVAAPADEADSGSSEGDEKPAKSSTPRQRANRES